MRCLIGVILKNDSEQLFVLDKGNCVLSPVSNFDPEKEFGNYSFLKTHSLILNDHPVGGSGVFRFRYGPVTSGIREAGCFNLYTYGEKILRASIDLTWKHKNVVRYMKDKPIEQIPQLAESVCGNFTFSHSVACSRAIETASGITVDLLTKNWRIILLEVERIYNHLHVIYKLASAAAQKVLAAHLSALFEEALRLNRHLTGSRFLKGINGLGRLHFMPDTEKLGYIILGYKELAKRFRELYEHSLGNPNFLDRLHGAGTLTPAQAIGLGLTGPSLRACGVKDDLNGTTEHLILLPVITQNEGDALARMETRSEEIINSCQYIIDHLKVSDSWQDNGHILQLNPSQEGTGCGISNSPSGAIGYCVEVQNGKVSEISIFTPSYPGMQAISQTLEGLVFTDFPFVFDSFGVHFTDAAR
jgi:Ni,Fe-hydrogenase III large subunit